MNRTTLAALASGLGLGVLLMATTAASDSLRTDTGRTNAFFSGGAIEEVNLPRRNEGVSILGSEVLFATTDTKLEDLPRLPNASQNEDERYQVVPHAEGFLMVDSRSGLVYEFSGSRVRLYNPTVPNHIISSPLRFHNMP